MSELIPDTVVTPEDVVFIHQQWKTVWQYDRDVQGNQFCTIVRPTWVGANPATGEQGTRSDVVLFAAAKCYHQHIPDEFIAASNGVFQSGAMDVILYEIGQLDPTSLIILEDGKYYRIIYQKWVHESNRSELRCNPYHA